MTAKELIDELSKVPSTARVVMQVNNSTVIPTMSMICEVNDVAELPDYQVTLFGYIRRDGPDPLVCE